VFLKVVCIVGMSGSGKSEVSRVFEERGFARVRFGDITDQEIRRRGLEPGEAAERQVRETLRREHGMAAYAVMNVPRIDAALRGAGVVVDGLYSWEEYLYLKDRYGADLYVLAVYSSPETRYARLAGRTHRGLTREQAASRDRAEIENVNKGGPIAMADTTLINEAGLAELREQTERILNGLS
jgi:dephospho-CoA kinase